MRNALTRFLLVGLLTVVGVSLPVGLWIGEQAKQHALAEATLRTHQLADFTVRPLVTEELRAGGAAAVALIGSRLEPWLRDGSIVRVKVWNEDGKILYSDSPALIGHVYPLPDWSEDLLAGGPEHAWFGWPNSADNANEALAGELVEVNVRSTDAAGRPIIFEAYFDDWAVQNAQSRLWLDTLPVLVTSLLVLQLAQLMPAVRLARRIQADQAMRRRLVQHAIVASDFERQRIATELHDEVIQDLAGLSYALEAEETHGALERRSLAGTARGILQRNLRTLRAITTELYPPDLERLGLNEALLRLTDRFVDTGITIRADLPGGTPLDRDRNAVLYRVAREALANAVKHAECTVIDLSLCSDDGIATLTVRDDGRGFDPALVAPYGHLGLRIMRDTVHMAGGSLSISTRSGHGTTIIARISLSTASLPLALPLPLPLPLT